MIIFGLIVIAILFSILYSRWEEKKIWNNGKCKCGYSWLFMDSSDYGDLYVCPNCEHIINLVYKVKYAKDK